jgi:hypothetical protein
LKEITVSVEDEEYAFIQKAKAILPKEWGDFEQFLLRTGMVGFIRYLMTGSVFESEDTDNFWHNIFRAILDGYEEWLSKAKVKDISTPPSGLYG